MCILCWIQRIFLSKIIIKKNILLLNTEKWKNFYYFAYSTSTYNLEREEEMETKVLEKTSVR